MGVLDNINREWLCTCITAGEFLYGAYPVNVLKKMYEQKKGQAINMNDLINAIEELKNRGEILMEYQKGRLDESKSQGPGFLFPVDCGKTQLEAVMRKLDREGNPYASLHFDEEEIDTLLIERPDDLEYFIPGEKKIEELVSTGVIRTKELDLLEEEMKKKGLDPEAPKKAWGKISTDKLDTVEAMFAILGMEVSMEDGHVAASLLSLDLDGLNELQPFVMDYQNSIHLRARKGWRPDELSRKMYPSGITQMPVIQPGSLEAAKMLKEAEPFLREMGAMADYSSIHSYSGIGEYGERKRMKVGRNDPCPCGSGKKFKKCHGRGL